MTSYRTISNLRNMFLLELIDFEMVLAGTYITWKFVLSWIVCVMVDVTGV
jgi:hypothetical protein